MFRVIPYFETAHLPNRKAGRVKVHKFGPVLSVNTNYHQGKPGIEMRMESSSGDDSESWGTNSRGKVR